LLAIGYFNLKDLVKSEASARHAIALDPTAARAYTLLADIEYANGSVENAKTDLRAAIRANPRDASNYMGLKALYEKEANWEEAKKVCEKAHEVDPDSPQIANELAYLYLEHGGDVSVALSLAQLARQKMPNSPNAADTLGWAYYKLGAPALALAHLTQASHKDPKNPVYHYHLGMADMAAGHVDSAARSLQQALRVDPNFPDAVSVRIALAKISKAAN